MRPLSVLDWAINLMKDVLGAIFDPMVEGLIKAVFKPILDAFVEAVGTLMSTIATFWVYVPTIAIGNDEGQPANSTVEWIWGHTEFIAVFLAGVALVFGAIQMAWTQRGESARDLLRALITLAIASAFSIAIAQALIEVGDMFSSCIISTALDSDSTSTSWVTGCQEINSADSGDFGTTMTAVLGFGAAAAIAGSPLLIGIMIAIGVLTVLASLIQIVLMVVRSAMLILLIGVLPIAAAATNTEMGRTWFKRIVSWLLAFILYKPVAAIIYATAIRLVSNNGDLSFDYITEGEGALNGENIGHLVMNVVTGLTMLVLALFAMPALMRFIVPMVGATAGGAGAGMLAAKMAGVDKLGDLANKGTQGADSGGDGPTGAQNVGRASQQAPSSGGGGGASGAGGGGGGASGAATTGGGGGAAAGGAGGGAAGGGAAAGGGGAAAGGAAAGAGAAAAVAAPVAIVAAGVAATKAAGQTAASETIGNDEMDQGSQSSPGSQGGDGGGPSGSGGGGDLSRERDRARDYRDQRDRQNDNRGNQPPPDGPSGSG
ncbi:hypothetical protein [Kribbella sp. NPDC048915]|uniref:hypothetical protein n=1 Tax=Kribbella sp. NPDC048915 TaxID=3155148 RepID=UPI00340D7522